MTEAQRAGKLGARIVDILSRHSPRAYVDSLHNLSRDLSATPGIGRLVAAALQDESGMIRARGVVLALRGLTPTAIAEVRAELLEIGAAAPLFDRNVRLGAVLIEVFSAANDWEAAQAVADAAVAKIGETQREYTRRLAAKLIQASVAFERAIAEGRTADLDRLGAEWQSLSAELEAATV
jgi:hypothetical protein